MIHTSDSHIKGKVVSVEVSVMAGVPVTWAYVLQKEDLDFSVTDGSATGEVILAKTRVTAKDGPQVRR